MRVDASPRAWVLPEEPVPVRLMSTIWADADGVHDDLAAPADVDAWLEAVGISTGEAHAGDAELAAAIALRDAVRRLAAYLTGDDRQIAASAMTGIGEATAVLNHAVRHSATPMLANRDGRLRIVPDDSVSAVSAGLAQVAGACVQLFGSDEAHKLRACYAPGCVLYFVKSHPRREWCSVACGNRARAARHYQKVRDRRSHQS